MGADDIQVKTRWMYPQVEDAADIDLDAEPIAIEFEIKKTGKNGFETKIRVPVGEVPSLEFAKGVKALYLASQAFHHHMYNSLREKLEEVNRG